MMLSERFTSAVSFAQVAVLYGSTARGDGDVDSDIDLLVVCTAANRAATEDRLLALAGRVGRWTGNEIQANVLTPSDIKRLRLAGDPVLGNIRRDAIVLAGDVKVLR